jgi:membrane-associated progesterone receptor component
MKAVKNLNLDELKKAVDLDGDIKSVGDVTISDLIWSFLSEDWKKELRSLYMGNIETKHILIVVITTIIVVIISYFLFFRSSDEESSGSNKASEGANIEEKEPPRDFTLEQLREFNGENDKPIYVSLRREVYDVSKAADFYGKGNSYNCFAGREASRAMAKFSFDEEDLSNIDISDISPFERDQLDSWVEKYKYYKGYPIVGK